ncbi:MAG TPA: hypothetical protein VGJ20_18470 [Xanthobacteraceae bacterium]|jgi:hypothetical protein
MSTLQRQTVPKRESFYDPTMFFVTLRQQHSFGPLERDIYDIIVF